MDRLTPLEAAVLAALADELSAQIPDLAGQVEEALPGHRRVTPEGFRTEIIVDRRRPAPLSGPTGWLGTVHADALPLEHPVAFLAEFVGGRLIGLAGTTYGEDATMVDWSSVQAQGLFTITVTGRSLPWAPTRLRPEDSPLRDLQKWDQPDPLPVEPQPPIPETWRALGGMIFGGHGIYRPMPLAPPTLPTPSAQDHLSWVIGVWTLAVALAAIAVLFGLPWIFAPMLAFYVGGALQTRRNHERLRKLWAAFRSED